MIQSLLLTIFIGVFFLIGFYIPKFFHNQNKLITISIGFTFIIMFYLILFDLIPEIFAILNPLENTQNVIIILIFLTVGFLSLKILDFFVPEHNHNHQEEETNLKEHNDHLFHIGIITAISLIIHNILEGMSVYITSLNSLASGLLMAVSVGLHNLPLGIEISASMNSSENKKITKLFTFILLIFSSSFGALLLFLFHTNLNVVLEGILMSLTLGMLLYILFCELFHEIKENKKSKELKIGILLGIIITIIMIIM